MADYKKIEDLKNQEKTSDAVFEGLKAANGWKAGKEITEEAYRKAVDDFNRAPIDGRKISGKEVEKHVE